MKRSLNHTLIETTIRNVIKQIKDDPERNIRNAIDMALTFSRGRFQQHFLKSAQTMLQDPTSCYYKLVPDLINNVDTERIVSFGMNIGYNSCTIGARKIRDIESLSDFNIPWSLFLELSGDDYQKNSHPIHSLISQGRDLGIYTWLIYSLDSLCYFLELARSFPECTFTFFCNAEEITPSLLDEANDIYNIMFVLKYDDDIEAACALLRSRKFLYSISYYYDEKDIKKIINDELLIETENLYSVFTLLYSKPTSFKEVSSAYQHVLHTRAAQKYKTIPFDIIYDNYWIDSIISDQPCSLFFTRSGTCYSLTDQILYENYNYFTNTLFDILKKVSPQKK